MLVVNWEMCARNQSTTSIRIYVNSFSIDGVLAISIHQRYIYYFSLSKYNKFYAFLKMNENFPGDRAANS